MILTPFLRNMLPFYVVFVMGSILMREFVFKLIKFPRTGMQRGI